MTTTGACSFPIRWSAGLTPSPIMKRGRRFRLPLHVFRCLELVLQAHLELALIVADLAVFLERRIVARAGTPGRIIAVEPVEDVERGEVDRRFVAPRHLEGLGDAQV